MLDRYRNSGELELVGRTAVRALSDEEFLCAKTDIEDLCKRESDKRRWDDMYEELSVRFERAMRVDHRAGDIYLFDEYSGSMMFEVQILRLWALEKVIDLIGIWNNNASAKTTFCLELEVGDTNDQVVIITDGEINICCSGDVSRFEAFISDAGDRASIFEAVDADSLEHVEKLVVKSGEEILNARDAVGNSLLHCVQSEEMAKALIMWGADPRACNVDQEWPYQLFSSFDCEQEAIFWILFDAAYPFYAAVRCNDIESMRRLKPDRSVEGYDRTEIYSSELLAVEFDRVEALAELVEWGLDVFRRYANNRTLADCALASGSRECLKWLIRKGIDVSQEAVFRAAARGHIDCLKYLRQNGIELGGVDKFGYTALHYAGTADTVDFLVGEGVGLECATKRGVTPVMYTSYVGKNAAARRLLELGADWTMISKHPERGAKVSVYDVAVESAKDSGDYSVVELIHELHKR